MATLGEVLKAILDALKAKLGVAQISDADLEAQLDHEAQGTGLQWRTSVVDFLKLIGADSSRANRAALALELGVEGEAGDATTNEALRVALFKSIKAHGGNVPASLLD